MEENWIKSYKPGRHPIVSILDKMIAKELLKTVLSVWMVIVVIIVSKSFIKVLDKAIEGQISNETLLSILGLRTVISSVSLLPPALFMSVLMVLGRMYRDYEMSAVSSAGGGPGVIYRATFLSVVPLAILALWLSFYAAPWAEAKTENLLTRDEQSADLRGIAEGKFSEYSGGDLVFYVERISADDKMHNIFVQHRQSQNIGIINAESGRLQDLADGRYMVFEKGERIQGQPGELDYFIEEFVEYAVKIEEKKPEFKFNRKTVPTASLWNSSVTHDIAELQNRILIPLGIIWLSFLAVPLAQISPRGGVYGNIMMGFLIYFIYGNFTRMTQVWVIKAKISGLASILGINMALFSVGIVLLMKLYGYRWLIKKIRTQFSV